MEGELSENDWTPALEKLLRGWRESIHRQSEQHRKKAHKFYRHHYFFGIPSTVISSITTSGMFATFQNCEGDHCDGAQWARLVFALVSIVSVVLSGIMTFMNYGVRSEEHKTTADKFEKLLRKIETTLKLPPHMRKKPNRFINKIRMKIDEVTKESPSLGEIRLPEREIVSPPSPERIDLHLDSLTTGELPPPVDPSSKIVYHSLKEANNFELGRLPH